MPNFFDLLQVYMIPFAIAVPIGLLLIFFGTRRSGETRFDDIEPRAEPSGHPSNSPDKYVDIAMGQTTQFRAPAPNTVPGNLPTLVPDHGVSVSPGGGIDLGVSGTYFGGTPAAVSILVVDDSAVPRAKLKKLFEAQGYEVTVANDGVQALEAMAKTRFSVVITDLEMPHMDGFELIAAIQGSLDTEDIPVIAITGHEEMQARVHNIQGLYGIFKKPWNDRELLKRVDVLSSLKK
jgi:CheY-like chemotaxis protein